MANGFRTPRWFARGETVNVDTGSLEQDLYKLSLATGIIDARAFGGTEDITIGPTKEQMITAAIQYAAAVGATMVLVPKSMRPYTASSVTFNSAVQLVTESLDVTKINVQAYGAKGDGVTDDTVAFNAAVVAASVSNGIAYVPQSASSYLIDPDYNGGKSIRMLSNVTLRLATGAVLQAKTNSLAGSAVIFCNTISNFVIEGGQIIGDRTAHGGNPATDLGFGVLMRTCTTGWIRNIYIKDCQGDGLYIGATASTSGLESIDITIHNVICDNCRRQGLSVTAAKRVRITGSAFINTNGNAPQGGIDFEPNAGTAVVQDCTVAGCNFENNSGVGVITASTAAQITITTSTFRNNRNDFQTSATGPDIIFAHNVIVRNNTTNASLLLVSDGTIVEGNIITGTTLQGMQVSGSYVVIKGNKLVNSSLASSLGILLNTGTKCTVEGNIISGFMDAIQYSSDWHKIIGNTCRNNINDGIHGTGDYIELDGNTCEGNGLIGILMGVSASCTIKNNQVHNNGDVGLSHSCSNSLISNNSIIGNSTTTDVSKDGIVQSAGSNCLYEGNIARTGPNANRQRYGINIAAACVGNRLYNNDFIGGGATGDFQISTSSTSTVVGGLLEGPSLDRGDAAVTLTNSDFAVQRFATALTADRDVLLPAASATTAWAGMRFRFIRSAGGAFNLNIKTSAGTLIKAMAAASAGSFILKGDSSGFMEESYGLL